MCGEQKKTGSVLDKSEVIGQKLSCDLKLQFGDCCVVANVKQMSSVYRLTKKPPSRGRRQADDRLAFV